MGSDIRERAFALYTPPFRYEMGYVWDAKGQMVAYDRDGANPMRVRGWGRIGYMPDAADLQDTVGALMAEALTEYWNRRATKALS